MSLQHKVTDGHFDYLLCLYMKFTKSSIKSIIAKRVLGHKRGMRFAFLEIILIKTYLVPAKLLNK